jgi:membrane associated rhomboid family serine protease
VVFVPLSDENPRLVIRYPVVSWGLIAINLAVYTIFQSGLVFAANDAAVFGYGVIPAVLFGSAVLPPDLVAVPAASTFLTSLFLHGDPIHLIGNLLFILVFADNIEDSMGHFRFALFYLLCGAAGAAAHALALPESQAPLIGASGAISGVVAAYLLLHPRVKMWILLFGRIPLKVTAFWIILAWAGVQVVSAVIGGDEAIGWWAHIGGFAGGVLLVPLFKRPEVPWFGRAPKTI